MSEMKFLLSGRFEHAWMCLLNCDPFIIPFTCFLSSPEIFRKQMGDRKNVCFFQNVHKLASNDNYYF